MIKLMHLFSKSKNSIKCGNASNQLNLKKGCKYRNLKINMDGNDNRVYLKQARGHLDIHIIGNKNEVVIGDNFLCRGKCKILIIGSGNSVSLGNDVLIVDQLLIYCHDHSKNCSIKIGNRTSFYKTEISTYENGSSISIGEDCMFGYDTIVYNTDGHAIFHDGKIINRATDLTIGNHVWCGWASTILKNSYIPSGCIVARGGVVCGKFYKENSILAGVPVKIVKENIYWDRRSVNAISEENAASDKPF